MNKQKILVIEDDADIREIIRFYLEEEGFSVVEAPNANNIVDVTKQEKPDLITLDIRLPGVDGATAINLLKGTQETKSIPILIISVIAKDPRIQQLKIGGYISKPFEKQELIDNVRKILQNPQKTQKVLIVDDEPDVVEIISTDLRDRGFIPIKAFDGQEAVEKATQEKPDVIILDIRMPKLDGFEVMNILSQNKETYTIPIIVLPGINLTEQEKNKGIKLGVSKFLTKPFEPQKLAREIHDVLCEKKES